MGAVMPRKLYPLVVVQKRPRQTARQVLFLVAVVAAILAATYWYAHDRGLALGQQVLLERDALSLRLDKQTLQVTELRQQITQMSIGGDIDKKATEDVQGAVVTLQNQIAELEEEVHFYKRVMDPISIDTGLRIERLVLQPTADARRYRYRLLLIQKVDKHHYIQGGVKISVRGVQNEEVKALALSELNKQVTGSLRYRFKYYQYISGEMTLPEGFVPEQVQIVAQSTGSGKKQKIDTVLDWQLEG